MKVTRPGFPATGTIQDKEARRSIDALNKAFIDLASALSEDRVVEQADVALDEGDGIEIELLGKNRFRITCTVKATESVGGGTRTALPRGDNDGDILFWKNDGWTVASMAGLAAGDAIQWDATAKTYKKLTPQEVDMMSYYGWSVPSKWFERKRRKLKVFSAAAEVLSMDNATNHADLHG